MPSQSCKVLFPPLDDVLDDRRLLRTACPISLSVALSLILRSPLDVIHSFSVLIEVGLVFVAVASSALKSAATQVEVLWLLIFLPFVSLFLS